MMVMMMAIHAVAEGFEPVLFHGRYFNRRACRVHLKVFKLQDVYR